jgi:hypothetical protein
MPFERDGEHAKDAAGTRPPAASTAAVVPLVGRSRPLRAGVANAEDVQAMAVRLKTLSARELVDRSDDVSFQLRRQREVDDFPAVDAEEMVVVLSQVLGELETRELVVRRDSSHQSC